MSERNSWIQVRASSRLKAAVEDAAKDRQYKHVSLFVWDALVKSAPELKKVLKKERGYL